MVSQQPDQPYYLSELEHAAADVQSAIKASIEGLFGARPRPKELIDRLGLDKSLAGRLLKVARAPDSRAVALEGPSVKGLGLFREAAADYGLSKDNAQGLQEAITRLEGALRSFPGGRSGIAAALGSPSGGSSAVRRARQDAFRAMTTLMGAQMDLFYVASFYAPSEEDGRWDTVWLSSRQGLRRLGSDSNISLGWIKSIMADRPSLDRLTIDGTPLSDDPRDPLLRAFCSGDIEKAEIARGPSMTALVVPPGVPRLGEQMTSTSATYQPSFAPRFATDERLYNCTIASPHRPTRRFIADHIIHRDFITDDLPIVKSWLGNADTTTLLMSPDVGGTDVVEQEVSVTRVTPGRGIASPEVWRGEEMVQTVFDARSWDASAFCVFRVEVDFPVIGADVATWFRLPERG